MQDTRIYFVKVFLIRMLIVWRQKTKDSFSLIVHE